MNPSERERIISALTLVIRVLDVVIGLLVAVVVALAIITLSACGSDRDVRPDAAQPAADAAVEHDAGVPAPCPGYRGPVGNLPDSRTITINTGDPIPPAIINELQDEIIAGSRKAFKRSIWPVISSGAASVAEAANPANASYAPVRKTTGACTLYLEIPYDEGDIVTGLSFDAYGDGAVDVSAVEMRYATDYNSSQSVLSTPLAIVNVPASWNTYSLSSFTPTTLSTGPLVVLMTVSAANFYFSRLRPSFRRP